MTDKILNKTYQTTCEKEFIDGVRDGKWVIEDYPGRAQKALHGYIAASKRRDKWPANVDAKACIAHAEGVLKWI